MRNHRLIKQFDAMNAPLFLLLFLICLTMSIILIVSTLIQSMEGSHGIGGEHPLAHALSVGMMRPSWPNDESATTRPELSAVLQDPERQRILNILRQARYNLHDSQIFSAETLNSLPKWSDIMDLYGKPRIVGLDSCQRYRQQVVDQSMRTIGVAGMFNSGTNVLHYMLMANCINRAAKDSTGVLWQVPWGKHVPASQRSVHANEKLQHLNYSAVLPVVIVRDPYTWMQSMCRQSYAVQFDHSTDPKRKLCPNIVPYEEDIRIHPRYRRSKYIPAHAKYLAGLNVKYDSIAHLWNEWYREYANTTAEFPRLIVRMEDILFRAEEVLPQICNCFGGTMSTSLGPNQIRYYSNVANQNPGVDNGKGSGLLRSIINYGNKTLRRDSYQAVQFKAAKEVLDPSLMKLFGYRYEEP